MHTHELKVHLRHATVSHPLWFCLQGPSQCCRFPEPPVAVEPQPRTRRHPHPAHPRQELRRQMGSATWGPWGQGELPGQPSPLRQEVPLRWGVAGSCRRWLLRAMAPNYFHPFFSFYNYSSSQKFHDPPLRPKSNQLNTETSCLKISILTVGMCLNNAVCQSLSI